MLSAGQADIEEHTASSSSVTHVTLPFFTSGDLHFRFRDYFRLIARCIVHTCAWRRYTISPAHLIRPKWQRGVGDLGAVVGVREESWSDESCVAIYCIVV